MPDIKLPKPPERSESADYAKAEARRAAGAQDRRWMAQNNNTNLKTLSDKTTSELMNTSSSGMSDLSSEDRNDLQKIRDSFKNSFMG